ncbi:MAG: VWA domain-containing protein [Actinomycetes bacterium]
MTFQSPWLLLLLLVVPVVLAVALIADRGRSRYPVAFTNLDLLAGVVQERRSVRRWIPVTLLLLSLTFAAGAVARPSAHFSAPDEHATVVLLVDVSGSMRANDVRPTRLAAAVAAMRTFLDRVPPQFQVGLVEFSSETEVLSDPTTDREALRAALGYLDPQAATAIGDGLHVAVQMAVRSVRSSGYVRRPGTDLPAAIVLLSDGKQNHGTIPPLAGAREAKAAGIRVYPVSLGTPHGKVVFGFGTLTTTVPVPPDPLTMAAVARATGGNAYTADSASTVVNIYRTLGSSLGRVTKPREMSSWFAAAAAVLLIGAVGAGRAFEGRLP